METNKKEEPLRRLSFKERIKKVKTTRWIRFAVVSAVYIFWVILMGNPWLLFGWLILADIYITDICDWGWWKRRKGMQRTVMAWVDAIVYALVLIYFVFAFIGQQYEIPSSSLEKTLLVGDRLWVDKATFGARVPQTPLHFPLAQHTMPILNTKSYIENPQLSYHRLPGLRSIERGDIVVFNYPQGDTVAVKIPNPDYYQISYELKKNGVDNPLAYIKSNPQMFGEVVVRPVDRRENYVKRTIGLPGERIKIVDDVIYINGQAIKEPENVQYNYIVPVSGNISEEKWKELGVRLEDVGNAPEYNESAGFRYYNIPLTKAMKAEIEKWPEVVGPLIAESESGFYDLGNVFPLGNDYGWTRTNMGEFWIPKRGATLHLTKENYPIYERAIRTYEGNDLKMTADGKIFINGKETEYYTFKMDYYWMQGDNRDRSADSRYWGFVPEDHVVGEPVFVILSLDSDRGLFDGKIRWNRIFKKPNPDGNL
ncbi:MAG: S26 family signal peptidase [Muribaculaceae bacterium]|nr:S26 family signal peptidase [Muribaculaceae bacterium]